jgi:hypothetical protein
MATNTQMIRTAWHDLLTDHQFARPAPASPQGQTAAQPAADLKAAPAGHWLTWRRLPAALELVTLGAGYAAPSLVRLALPAAKHAAFAHAAELYHAEQQAHLNVEPYLNHLVSAHTALAVLTGYYYGTLHFILTPLVLAWLYLRRPAAFPRLRSALVLSTIGANIVFWTWPVAPPRFAVPGMNDILVTHDILGSADPHGVTSAVNLYAAMPSLHICWAAWCAAAVVTVTRSRWRHLAWLYPATTTLVVLASANHFMLDVIGGLAITALGMAATRMRPVRAAGVLRSPGTAFQAAPPSTRTPAPGQPGPADRFARLRCGPHDGRAASLTSSASGSTRTGRGGHSRTGKHRSEVARNALCQDGLRGNLRQRRGIPAVLLHRGQR